MRKTLAFILAIALLLTVAACGANGNPIEKAKELPAEENKIGLKIDEVSIEDEEYRIKIDWDYGVLPQSNLLVLVENMLLFDQDDLSSSYDFFDEDDRLQYTLDGEGKFRVQMPQSIESDMAILYFSGISEDSKGADEDMYTSPMFFKLQLGDNPAVLSGPLRAGDIFDAYLPGSTDQ